MIRGKQIVAAVVSSILGAALLYLSVTQAWHEIHQLYPGWKEARYTLEVYWVWANNHAWYGVIGALLLVTAVSFASSGKDHALAYRAGGGSLLTAGIILVGVLLLQAWEYGQHNGRLSSVAPSYGPAGEFAKMLMECWLLLAVGVVMISVGAVAWLHPRCKTAKAKAVPIPAFTGIWTMCTVLHLGRVYAVVRYDHEGKKIWVPRSRMPAGIHPGDRLQLEENGAYIKME